MIPPVRTDVPTLSWVGAGRIWDCAGGAASFPVVPPVRPDAPLFWVGAGRIWDGGGRGRWRSNQPTTQKSFGLVWISVRPETSVPDSLRQCDALPAGFFRGLTVMTCGCRRGGADRGCASGNHRAWTENLGTSTQVRLWRPRPGRPPCASGYPTLLPPTEGGGGINVSTSRSGPLRAQNGGERPEVLLPPTFESLFLSLKPWPPNNESKM